MDEQSAQLAKHVLRDVAGALCGYHRGQAVFAAFLGNQAKRIKRNMVQLVTYRPTNKLVRLIKETY